MPNKNDERRGSSRKTSSTTAAAVDESSARIVRVSALACARDAVASYARAELAPDDHDVQALRTVDAILLDSCSEDGPLTETGAPTFPEECCVADALTRHHDILNGAIVLLLDALQGMDEEMRHFDRAAAAIVGPLARAALAAGAFASLAPSSSGDIVDLARLAGGLDAETTARAREAVRAAQ